MTGLVPVPFFGLSSWMTDPDLRPATPDDIEQALAFALSHNGRKAYRLADDMMARIVATHLVKHLELSGFVLMRKRPRSASTT